MMTPAAAVRRIGTRPDLLLAVMLMAYGLYRAAQVLPGRLPHPIVFAILIGTGAYLALRGKLPSDSTTPPSGTRTMFAASDVVYATTLVVALLIWHQSLYVVPPHYFLALTVAAGSILFDAIYGRTATGGTRVVLGKVILLGILLRAMAYYQFPGPIGSDPWRHVLTIATTASTGHVIDHLPNALGTHNGYSSIPVFHILAAISSNVGGISAKAAAFVAASVPQVLSVLSIFLLGRVVRGERAGVLAALLYCVADYSVLWGVQVIAMTLATAIAACLIWLLLSGRSASPPIIGIALLLVVALILCHTISAFVVFIALATVVTIRHVRRLTRMAWGATDTASILGPSIVALYGVFMLVWWMTMPTSTGDSFFAVQAAKLADVLTTAAEAQAPSGPVAEYRPYAHLLYDAVGSALLIGMSIYAALASFASEPSRIRLLTITIAAAALIAFQAIGSSSLQEAVIGARWVIFQYMFLAAMAAWVLTPLLSRASGTAFRLGLVAVMCVVYVLPMLTNSTANQSSPLWATTTPRMGYTASEQTAWRTLVTDMQVKPVGDGYYIGAMATVTSSTDYEVLSTSNTELFIERGNYLARPELNEVYLSVIGDIRDISLGYYRLEGQPVFITGYAAKLALTGGVVYTNDTTRMVQLTS